MKKEELKVIARNKKANHEYFILETYEAGIQLVDMVYLQMKI